MVLQPSQLVHVIYTSLNKCYQVAIGCQEISVAKNGLDLATLA